MRTAFAKIRCDRACCIVGTENGLYVSFDDGENWEPLQSNLPRAPVYWMVVQEHFNDLVIATYGRGFWILDDLTPIQQMNANGAQFERASVSAASDLSFPQAARL